MQKLSRTLLGVTPSESMPKSACRVMCLVFSPLARARSRLATAPHSRQKAVRGFLGGGVSRKTLRNAPISPAKRGVTSGYFSTTPAAKDRRYTTGGEWQAWYTRFTQGLYQHVSHVLAPLIRD